MAQASEIHVAVVGAGAFGAWTAYALREAGARVSLLDARGAGNSMASSGGESRILRCVYGADERYARMTRRALDKWTQFSERWDLPCFVEMGAIWLFSGGDPRYVTESLPYLDALEWPVEELDPRDLPRRFPALSAGDVERAWWEPRAGLIHARRSMANLTAVLQGLGVDYRSEAARPGKRRGGKLLDLQLSDGSRLEADAYVFACGPWLPRLFPDLLEAHTKITRQETYFFMPPAGDSIHRFPRLPIWLDFGENLFYGLPLDNLRGFKLADDDRGYPFDPDLDDRMPSAWRVDRAREFLARRFPAMAQAPLQESRVCQYLNSSDGDFIMDQHPEVDNLWLAGAGSGHAFKMGPVIGEMLSGMVLGKQETEPAFSLSRLSGSGHGSFSQFAMR